MRRSNVLFLLNNFVIGKTILLTKQYPDVENKRQRKKTRKTRRKKKKSIEGYGAERGERETYKRFVIRDFRSDLISEIIHNFLINAGCYSRIKENNNETKNEKSKSSKTMCFMCLLVE